MRPSKTRRLKDGNLAVIGEGITEQFYLNSLDGLHNVNLKPKLPKHSVGLKFLENKIKDCIEDGYTKILCLIDMDNKKLGKEKQNYLNLKNKYHNKTFTNKKEQKESTIYFYENERCIEFWFLLHFKERTKQYLDQKTLIDELFGICSYKKEKKFFKECGGLHSFFEKNGGSLNNAIERAKNSIETKDIDNRDYSYSEMESFFKEIDYKTCKGQKI
jgi:hypothetical protein